MKDNIKKRIEVFESIAKTGKCNTKTSCVAYSSLYDFIDVWKEIGLIEVVKSGRELKITLTKKGNEYLNYLSGMKKYSDFFL